MLVTRPGHPPQALVYSLTVASKASTAARRSAANKILNKIREHSANLVDQAMMVSNELIRVAILRHEQWHEGLEEASRSGCQLNSILLAFFSLGPAHAVVWRKVLLVLFMIFELGPYLEFLWNGLPSEPIRCGVKEFFHPKN